MFTNSKGVKVPLPSQEEVDLYFSKLNPSLEELSKPILSEDEIFRNKVNEARRLETEIYGKPKTSEPGLITPENKKWWMTPGNLDKKINGLLLEQQKKLAASGMSAEERNFINQVNKARMHELELHGSPYSSEPSLINPENKKWWMSQGNADKLLAGLQAKLQKNISEKPVLEKVATYLEALQGLDEKQLQELKSFKESPGAPQEKVNKALQETDEAAHQLFKTEQKQWAEEHPTSPWLADLFKLGEQETKKQKEAQQAQAQQAKAQVAKKEYQKLVGGAPPDIQYIMSEMANMENPILPPAILHEILYQSQNQPTKYIPMKKPKSINKNIMSSFDPNLFSGELYPEEPQWE